MPRQGSGLPRGERARGRLAAALAELEDCRLCAHDCGVNRRAGERGVCQAGPSARVFSAQVEVSDELELIPVFAVALSGCDLRCAFCITGAESWNARAGEAVCAQRLGEQARLALARGARSVKILGGEPTIHLPSVLELVAALPEEAHLIWKTNAHGSARARALLDGLFDLWLADYKFGSDDCAHRLAGVANYTQVVQENLRWAFARGDLLVRHLLMPGHVDCCWQPVARWLGRELPGVKVNLRSGFWPAWKASRHSEMRRTVSLEETNRALALARKEDLRLVT